MITRYYLKVMCLVSTNVWRYIYTIVIKPHKNVLCKIMENRRWGNIVLTLIVTRSRLFHDHKNTSVSNMWQDSLRVRHERHTVWHNAFISLSGVIEPRPTFGYFDKKAKTCITEFHVASRLFAFGLYFCKSFQFWQISTFPLFSTEIKTSKIVLQFE